MKITTRSRFYGDHHYEAAPSIIQHHNIIINLYRKKEQSDQPAFSFRVRVRMRDCI